MSDSDQDPVEVMFKKTGCIESHYKVQECCAETHDWGRCQEQVKELRVCMQKYTDAQNKNPHRLKNVQRYKTAAQCAHAAVLCVQEAQSSNNSQAKQLLETWLIKGQPKIVLKVNGGYDDLIKLQKEAVKLAVTSALVQDAGHTQLAPGTVTVLGLGPDTEENIDKLVGHLKLL